MMSSGNAPNMKVCWLTTAAVNGETVFCVTLFTFRVLRWQNDAVEDHCLHLLCFFYLICTQLTFVIVDSNHL